MAVKREQQEHKGQDGAAGELLSHYLKYVTQDKPLGYIQAGQAG